MSGLTRQHFYLIAETLQKITDPASRREAAELFADALAPTNRKFDRDLFVKVSTKHFTPAK